MALDPLRVPAHLQRPGSSHSSRSVSRTSQRPTSRLSQRSAIKQPRLVGLIKTLVKQVTNLNEDDASGDFHEGLDLATRRIDQMKQASVPDLAQIDAQVRGHVIKARINIQDSLADALKAKYIELKANVAQRNGLNMDIKLATLPGHMQFLLLLSSPPTRSSLSQVERLLAGSHDIDSSSQPVTWEIMLQEEPFEGQHWQGAYGLPEGSTVENWGGDSSDIDDLSLLDDVEYDEDASSHESTKPIIQLVPLADWDRSLEHPKGMLGRAVVEALCDRQYWRLGWHTDANYLQEFDIGVPSSLGTETSNVKTCKKLIARMRYLGATHDRVLTNSSTTFTPQKNLINEVDAVREVLLTLQGRQSFLFESKTGGHDTEVMSDRRIVHLTSASQVSILGSYAVVASTLNSLRHLVHNAIPNPFEGRCRTLEAFSAAVERQLLDFDLWCARKEEHIGLAQQGKHRSDHVVSLLSLEREVGIKMAGTFVVLLDVARNIEARKNRTSPSALSTLILNTLLEAIRTRLAADDARTANTLADVWRETAEPLWSNLEKWLKDGIPIRVGFESDRHTAIPTWDAEEFFIRINPLVAIRSPDFWDGSYTLRPRHSKLISGVLGGECRTDEDCLPVFIMHVAEDILAAGKAIGLLRAIDMTHLVGDDWLEGWIEFKHLTEPLPLEGLGLEGLISDTLLPPCHLAQSMLRQVLVEECELWKHLQGLESVCLMSRGDAMSQFSEKLFARMDSRQPWNDYHFLNTAFREVTQLGSRTWIHPSLVRFTHLGNKDRSVSRTVRAIDGLAIEYSVPFPLTYLFGPESSARYSSLFCFLLQIRRAKNVLDRILMRGLNAGMLNYGSPDLKVFHLLRCRLSWFVNTLMNFIMTNVIHTSLLEFHNGLKDAGSLDVMISVHRTHLERLLGRCLLQSNTTALHQAILSILDLTLHLSDCLSAFAGDTSLDISRHSLVLMRHRHRRKGYRGRARKLDVIGFAEALPHSEEDSDSDEDGDVEPFALGNSFVSLGEEDFFGRLERMSLELDGLVRFVRRGVDSLAAGAGDASVTFGILAFCLEDWEL